MKNASRGMAPGAFRDTLLRRQGEVVADLPVVRPVTDLAVTLDSDTTGDHGRAFEAL